MRSNTQFKRFARPEEIADTVSFLVSEKASFITGKCRLKPSKTTRYTLQNIGQTINVDGGMWFD